MRKIKGAVICLFFLLPALWLPVHSADTGWNSTQDFWAEVEGHGFEPEDGLEGGIQKLLQLGVQQLGGLMRRSIQVGWKLLAVVLLCGLAEGAQGGRKEGIQVVELAGVLTVTALTVNDVHAMLGLGRETIARMDDFAGMLLPTMALLTAATGSVTGAAMRQGVTILCSDFLISTIDQLFVPLVYAYTALCCAYGAFGNEGLKKLAGLMKGVVTGCLTIGLLAFVGYLTASGAIAGSVDAAAIKAAKMTLARAVPVVGGVLADAAETMLAGAGVLRGTVGVAGMLVVLSICLIPFLQLGLHYLTYKGAAALTGTVAHGGLSHLMDHIGSAFGMILGMTGSCALVLLFSMVSTIVGVMGG